MESDDRTALTNRGNVGDVSTHFLTALATILLPMVLHAQITFERTYGGEASDEGSSAWQTGDGGYVITGATYATGLSRPDVYVVRTDARGDTLWTRTLGDTCADRGEFVQQTADGGYIVAGFTESFGAGRTDVYLMKFSASGDTLWTRTFGGSNNDVAYSAEQTIDGGYIITGYTYSFGAGSSDVYLVKTDASGDSMWTRTFGGGSYDWGNSVQQTADSGYIIVGGTISYGAGWEDVYLIKTDPRGTMQWCTTLGGSGNDVGNSVRQTTDSGYVLAGMTESFGAGDNDVFLVKTSANGDTVWTRTFGGPGPDWGRSVQQTLDGGYVVAGQMWTADTVQDMSTSSGPALAVRHCGQRPSAALATTAAITSSRPLTAAMSSPEPPAPSARRAVTFISSRPIG